MVSSSPRKKLGEILIERGALTRENLEKALELQKRQGGLIGQILIREKWVREEEVAIALATQFNFAYLALDSLTINPQVLKTVPAEFAFKFLFIPVDKIQNTLTIVMADPTNQEALREISERTGCRIQTFVGTVTDVTHALSKYYKGGEPAPTRKEK